MRRKISITAAVSDGTYVVMQDVTIKIRDVDENIPVFTSPHSVTVKENQLDAITLSATDDNTLTYSISGGDSTSFNIDDESGVITFKTAPDYESKSSYSFTAEVSDGTNKVTQNVIINIADVDELAPVFTSEANITVEENQPNALTLRATDEGNVTYSITGGDSAAFVIMRQKSFILFRQLQVMVSMSAHRM